MWDFLLFWNRAGHILDINKVRHSVIPVGILHFDCQVASHEQKQSMFMPICCRSAFSELMHLLARQLARKKILQERYNMFSKSSLALIAVFLIMVCSACGSSKHRLETCTHPSAKVIKKLRARVRAVESSSSKSKGHFKADRQGRKRGEQKELAMKAYTPKATEDKAEAEKNAETC